MDFTSQPSWLLHPQALREALANSSFSSANIGMYTSLSDSTSFMLGIRQFAFWKDEISPSLTDKTVVLSFLGPNGLTCGGIQKVYQALTEVCDMSSLIEVSRGANPSFLGLTFKDATEVKKILSDFLYFEDSFVLHLTHASNTSSHFSLLWLPPLFNESRVHSLLKSITSNYSFKRESIQVSHSTLSQSNVISGYLTPKVGHSLSDLPHLIKLPEPHRGSALLVVSGRSPLCLRCQEVGHMRRNCDMRRCSSCCKVHFPSSPCGTSSYSSIASRNVTKSLDTTWLGNLPDNETLDVSAFPNVSSGCIKAIADHVDNLTSDIDGDVTVILPSLLSLPNGSSHPVAAHLLAETSLLVESLPHSEEHDHNPVVSSRDCPDPTIQEHSQDVMYVSDVEVTDNSELSLVTKTLAEAPEPPCLASSLDLDVTLPNNTSASIKDIPTMAGNTISTSSTSSVTLFSSSYLNPPIDPPLDPVIPCIPAEDSSLNACLAQPGQHALEFLPGDENPASSFIHVPALNFVLPSYSRHKNIDHCRSKRPRLAPGVPVPVHSCASCRRSSKPSFRSWNKYVSCGSLNFSGSSDLPSTLVPMASVMPSSGRTSSQLSNASRSELKCLNCNNVIYSKWPLRDIVSCWECSATLSEKSEKRFYPIYGSVTVAARLSPKDAIQPSNIAYVDKVHSSGVPLTKASGAPDSD